MTSSQPSSLTQPRFITIDGLKIRYAESEPKNGDPILLLSPWPESIYAFLSIWNTLADFSPLIAVDLPGFGKSDGRPGAPVPEAMGEFVVRIIDEFGLDRPHVIGPDVGTSPSLFAALNHPGRLKSIVVGSGATSFPLDLGGVLKAMVEAESIEPFRQMNPEDFVRGAMSEIKSYRVPDFVAEDYIASYAGDRFINSMAFVRDYPNALPRLAARLSEINIPVQIIAGRKDPFLPVSNAAALHAGLSNSKLDILDCGHFTWEDEAAAYGQIVSAWVKGGYLHPRTEEKR
jgi:pimeloyl-ACP methyl ester carboxylesterase